MCQKGHINQSWSDLTGPLTLMCSPQHTTDLLSILTIVHSDIWLSYFSPLKVQAISIGSLPLPASAASLVGKSLLDIALQA